MIECYFCDVSGKYSVKKDALKKDGKWRNSCEHCFQHETEQVVSP